VAPGAAQFEHHYNEIAEPFDWTFTGADLTELNDQARRTPTRPPARCLTATILAAKTT
jgi:hypothetical protein